jgi:predicted N-acetyltransferase YhbS
MTAAEFEPLWDKHAPSIFDDNSQVFRVFQFLSEQERSQSKELREGMGTFYSLRLGVFFKGEFVGWSAGHQESTETYYMRNSAILPEHRKKGLYTCLLKSSLDFLREKGFQKIYSRHLALNNSVIIPKLKAGFVITSLEVNDVFGVLVHLSYYQNPLRRKML